MIVCMYVGIMTAELRRREVPFDWFVYSSAYRAY